MDKELSVVIILGVVGIDDVKDDSGVTNKFFDISVEVGTGG